MVNDDSQSISCALLAEDAQHLHSDASSQLTRSSSTKPAANSVRWTLRNNISTASLRRYRSPFRRSALKNGSIKSNSQYPPQPSFPLFRRFYLMRSSFARKRHRDASESGGEADALASSEKSYPSPPIEFSRVASSLLIILVSGCLLIWMILLDMLYLDDAIPNALEPKRASSPTSNSSMALCFRHPKVCVMKGLVIIVFLGATVVLCYIVLTLYTRAWRHTRVLERKTDELEKEKCLTEKLLHEILPPCVAKDLINGRKAPAEYYESVTVYFSDIVGFTVIAR